MKPFRIQNRETSARLGWRIEAKTNKADIYLYDQIGKDFWGDGTSASDFVQDLHNLDVGQIDLHINSPGGFVDDGLAMFNAIQQHPANVTAHVDGLAASAASFIAMAADSVMIAPHARMMIHDAIGVVDVFGLMNAGSIDDVMTNLSSMRDLLDSESDNIADIYAEKAGGASSQWRDRMQANGLMGTTYRGQEAVDAGLADGLDEATPKGTSDRHSQARMQGGGTPIMNIAPKEESKEESHLGASLSEAMKAARRESPQPTLESLLGKHSLKEAVSGTANGGSRG